MPSRLMTEMGEIHLRGLKFLSQDKPVLDRLVISPLPLFT